MNEETVPVVAQTLDPRLPAPCALGFLLIALLSQSVTVARLSRHLKSKREDAHLDLALPTRPATLTLPRNATHLRSCTTSSGVIVEPISIRTETRRTAGLR
jgi:hypothetical protein